MNFTYFHEIFLHQVLFHFNRPIGPKHANNEKPRVDRVSMPKNVYSAKFSVKTRLEHAFSIELTYFQ